MSATDKLFRIFWGMSSQTMASAINLSLTVLTARAVSGEDYGIFALGQAAVLFALLLARSLTAEVLVFQHSAGTEAERKSLNSACISAAVGLSIVGMLIFVLIGVFTESHLWFLFALSFLGLVAQDCCRYILIANRRVKTGSALDFICLCLTVLLLLIASAIGAVDWFIAAWGGAAWICAGVALFLIRPVVSPTFARRWLRIGRGQSKLFGIEFLLSNAVDTGSVFFVAFLLGAAAAGQIKAASILVFPVLLLTRGALLTVAAESNRLISSQQFRSVRVVAGLMSGATVLAALILIPIVAWVPREWLAFLLGDSANGAASVFPAVAIAAAATGLATGPSLVLKSAGWVRMTLIGKIVVLPLAAASVIVFSLLLGVQGSQIGLAIGEFLRAVWSFYFMRKWLRLASADHQKEFVDGGAVR